MACRWSPATWAYPRSRGATSAGVSAMSARAGLSPLPRGNLALQATEHGGCGPIPAPAGQPPWTAWRTWNFAAYPRSRGATAYGVAVGHCALGLSPLPRGNQLRPARDKPCPGPIPAPAGQPPKSSQPMRILWAYPRSRGATCPRPWRRCRQKGLSPLPRGNPPLGIRPPCLLGPIPAPAGQPVSPALSSRR